MKPLGDRVLIAPAQGTVVAAGPVSGVKVEGSEIIRPRDTTKFRPSEGVVEAVGEKVSVPVVVGDRVLFRWWAGIEFSVNGETLVLTEEKNVLAKPEDGETVE